MSEAEFVIVLTTLPPDVDAAGFARTLLEERLAACVSLIPGAESFYWWEGQIEQAQERQVLIKTTAERVDRLRERVTALHPYEVPELLILQIADGHAAYLRWIRDSTALAG